MHLSEEVKKMTFTMTLVWLALTATMFVYGILLFTMKKTAMSDVQDLGGDKNILIAVTYIILATTFMFYRKLDSLVRKLNVEKSPYARGLSEQDKKVMSYFGSYFVVHIVFWAMNEAAAILGFVLTMMSGNLQYYLYPALIAIFFNLVIMRPNYIAFIKGKNLE